MNLKLPLSDLSAFWGENYIGKIKKLVKSPYQPLTQILNRLYEIDNDKKVKIEKQSIVKKCIIDEDSDIFTSEGVEYLSVKSVITNNIYLTSMRPNNVLIDDIYILGRKMIRTDALFNYPTSSTDIGIIVGEKFSDSATIFSIKLVKNKCILLNSNKNLCAISLLHT